MKIKITKINCLLIALFLEGCGAPMFQESTATFTPSATQSITPTITKTLTITPTLTFTPIPIGQLIAYYSNESGHIQVYSIDIHYGTKRQITSEPFDVQYYEWSPDGNTIVYQINHASIHEIWSIRWDGQGNKLLVSDDGNYPTWSPDSTKIAFFSRRLGYWALFTMNPDGSNQRAITENTVFESIISWSPDSSKIAFNPWHNTESPPFIAIINADGTGYTELTNGQYSDVSPIWSPDGNRILFTSWRNGVAQIYCINPDGSEQHALTNSIGGNTNPVWSPDGESILFVSWRDSKYPTSCEDGDCNYEIYVMNSDGSQQINITNNLAEDWGGVWSPDGNKIAFQSLRDEPNHPKDCGDKCNSEIYMLPIDDSDTVRLTNNNVPDWGTTWRPES